MKLGITDKRLNDTFLPPPVKGSELLVPITTWAEMFRETQVTGVEFEEFWYKSVEYGVAYFFCWLGRPRATVLVVWNKESPTHVECRTLGDLLVNEKESEPIIAEVTKVFRDAGFWSRNSNH